MEKIKEIDVIYWLGTAIMLVFGFGLIYLALFYTNYVTKLKKKEAELLLKASLESEKKERERIAADLHDSVSSDLSAIRNYLAVILKSEQDDGRIAVFTDLKEGVETAIENTRTISYRLMPPLLEKMGLVAALDDYLQRLSKQTAVSFSLQKHELSLALDAMVSYELFRVVQEFTTNMLKYGAVTQCVVIPYVLQQQFFIEIIDDGLPYNFQSASAAATGTGLKNISSRLKAIEAQLTQRDVVTGNHFVISLTPN